MTEFRNRSLEKKNNFKRGQSEENKEVRVYLSLFIIYKYVHLLALQRQS